MINYRSSRYAIMKDQRGVFAIWIVLGALMVLGLMGGAFYLGTIYRDKVPVASVASPVPVASDMSDLPKNVELEPNWKTYSNSKFSISYPMDFYFKEMTEHLPVEDYVITSLPYENTEASVSYQPGEVLYITMMVMKGSLPTAPACGNGTTSNDAKSERYQINGYAAIKYCEQLNGGIVNVASPNGGYVEFTMDGFREGRFEEDRDILEKIINTIKFN